LLNFATSNHPQDKAIANAQDGSLYIPVYTNSVGYGIAYPWMVGNAKASASGMSNSSDTRASFFSVCFMSNNQIQMDLAFWVSALEKRKEKRNEETFIICRFILCIIDDNGARCDSQERRLHYSK